MKIAVGIVSLFKGGGLQQHCLAICDLLRRRGHAVELFAARCNLDDEAPVRVNRLPVRAFSNHRRDDGFGEAFHRAVGNRFDLVVGFNKLPGLDVLYCADPCLLARSGSRLKCLLPRYRTMARLEGACFASTSNTQILLLSQTAMAAYREHWRTPPERLTCLPPAIPTARATPVPMDETRRSRLRASFGIDSDGEAWLWVAAQPKTKGLDRLLHALASRPGARLFVVGLAGDASAAKSSRRLAARLGVDGQIVWLGYREDISDLMAMADLLVHPARFDMTGQVILEAIIAGLPVVTTGACGFAEHVQRARAGIVLAEPFVADALDQALAHAQDAAVRMQWAHNVSAYARANDFTRGFEAAADAIERIGARGST